VQLGSSYVDSCGRNGALPVVNIHISISLQLQQLADEYIALTVDSLRAELRGGLYTGDCSKASETG